MNKARKELSSIVEELATNKNLSKKDIAIRIELVYQLGATDGMMSMQKNLSQTIEIMAEDWGGLN
jgi:hypothetical protein